MRKASLLKDLAALCLRRGFVGPANEQYGGLRGCVDYAPLGVLVKRGIRDAWRRRFVDGAPDVYEVEASVLGSQALMTASGHLASFSDALVDCKSCKKRFRVDHLFSKLGEAEARALLQTDAFAPFFTDIRQFQLMMETRVGPVQETGSRVFLRPETAQSIFSMFHRVRQAMPHLSVPFGLAQIGRSFRNEVTTGPFLFRLSEFEQMELEYFCHPEAAPQALAEWTDATLAFLCEIGQFAPERIRVAPQASADLAHYAQATNDIEYDFPEMGWSELAGIAHRGDFDLRNHSQKGRNKLHVVEPGRGKFFPHVVEPSLGVDRLVMAVLCEAFRDETLPDGSSRLVLRLAPEIAPYTAAVLPLLSNNAAMVDRAEDLARTLARQTARRVIPMASGSIGKRYRRQDEIGTLFCITIDHQSLDDGSVTVRHRDTMEQERVAAEDLGSMLMRPSSSARQE